MCRIEALPRKQRIASKYFESVEEEKERQWQVLIALVLKLYVSFMGSGSFIKNEALWCRNPT
ncbi:hypothetical protein SADUNF_Sadunf01G0184900 [Salix dunnii]|uniref:Uncharacterized protein n=1 Tax=Salix dunnii TaxID=1413687 RepID=A0A835NBU9_9ROSI|nr:hypothetical protein SADUNF_Sadunf01G0184900 [Salix dunnii]